jgi:hypothetical protein
MVTARSDDVDDDDHPLVIHHTEQCIGRSVTKVVHADAVNIAFSHAKQIAGRSLHECRRVLTSQGSTRWGNPFQESRRKGIRWDVHWRAAGRASGLHGTTRHAGSWVETQHP